MQRNDVPNDNDRLTEEDKHDIYNPVGAVGNLGQDVPWTGRAGPEAQEGANDFYEEIGAAILGKDEEDVHEPDLDEDARR